MGLRERIGPYAVIERLGSGAMGEVFRATDPKMFGRSVAIKILSERLSGDRHARTRFQREIETASRLVHPNIVAIHDRGEVAGRPYFVMEYLEGPTLTDWIRAPGERPLDERLAVAGQICDALEFAHRHRIVHRDVKPGNVVLVGAPGRERAKLLDFGIVHVERSTLTRALTQPGTYSYMSPEQLRNEPIDPRSDLFSLGIVLHEMLTGVHPFDAPTEPLVAGRILSQAVRPLRELRSDIPAALDALVLHLLDKDGRRRPRTAASVGTSIAAIRRELAARASGVGDLRDGDLEALTRTILEDLRRWGRRREDEGRLDEAVRAYEKALGLDPEHPELVETLTRLRLRIDADALMAPLLAEIESALEDGDVPSARAAWRRAWEVGPEHAALRALELRLIDSTEDEISDPSRRAFVAERISLAERALDEGRPGDAAEHLHAVLERDPGDALARFLLDRSAAIVAAGVDYRGYREAIREGERALDRGEYARASACCARARTLWADDDEWRGLDGRVAGRIDAEVAEAIARGERLLRDAERAIGEPDAALRAVAGVRRAADRARELGAPSNWAEPLVAESVRLERDLRKAVDGRRRHERERRERSEKIFAEAFERATRLLERGRGLEDGGEGAVRDGEAMHLFEVARDEIVRALHEFPEHAAAAALAEEIETASARVLARVEARMSRRSEIRDCLLVVREGIEVARRCAEGDRDALERGIRRLVDCVPALDRLARWCPEEIDARAALEEANELRATLERRRDHEARRTGELDAALLAAHTALVEARGLATGSADDVVRAEALCGESARCFSRALTLDEFHGEAVEGRDEAVTLLEHLRSEIRRRQPNRTAGRT